MKKEDLKEIAQAAAKNIKSEADLNELKQMLTKMTLETVLNAELDEHLGYTKHEKSNTNNSRNGYTTKTLQTEDGQFELETPRDRKGDFEPQLVKKNQRRFVSMNDKVLFLYAQGLSTRETSSTLKEMYDTDISASLVSRITNAVMDDVIEWQARPLDSVYPIVYLDCIVHMVRNSVRYVTWKDYKALTSDLKKIYQSVTEDEALIELDNFEKKWDELYPQISRSWRSHWHNLNTLFNYPADIRKAIYTTNAIESLNSVIRKVIKKRKLFPSDDSAKKVVYLAIQQASKKWTMPIRNWKSALNRFMIEFEDRLSDYA